MADPTIPAGMREWSGGDRAPADWDGGPVLLRCGDMEPASLIEDADWQIGYPENGFKPSQVDVVAYTPALSTPTTPDEGEVLREALEECVYALELAILGQFRGRTFPAAQAEYDEAMKPVYAARAHLLASRGRA